jgi:hypothetical protein
MGKTVPSFRMALECEIDRWKGFREALPNEEEREAFDELMDVCRSFVSEKHLRFILRYAVLPSETVRLTEFMKSSELLTC